MEFSFTPNQEELKTSAIEFAKAKLNDSIEKRDRNNEFSFDCWRACAEFGLQGILVPERYGGLALDALSYAAIMEGIGQGCTDNGLIFSINAHVLTCVIPILHHGSEEQKDAYLNYLVSGELIGANAMTEADSGSDVYSLRTSAEKKNDYYLLNGSKTFVTNAPVADIFVVYAATGKTKGFFGLSCFLVEKDTDGLHVGNKIEKMGLRTSPMSELGFNNCKIPTSNLIGQEGGGGILFSSSMEWERGLILANCIGIMDRLLTDCVRYTNTRKLGAQPIGQHQAIAHKLAEMKVRLETSRLMLYKVAWLKSQRKTATVDSSIAKLVISESYIQNCRDAMQIFGGYGYMVEYELERELRDALASSLYSGTSEIQKNIIASIIQ
jgi:alkylation response protein AidB-like acyl-CoA dehydrogenase